MTKNRKRERENGIERERKRNKESGRVRETDGSISSANVSYSLI